MLPDRTMGGNGGEEEEEDLPGWNGTGRPRHIGKTERDGIRRFSVISKRVTERRPLRCNAEAWPYCSSSYWRSVCGIYVISFIEMLAKCYFFGFRHRNQIDF